MQIRELLEPRERGVVDELVEQRAVHRAHRAKRAAGAPAGKIEILAMRPARGEHLLAHARADSEDRINAGERAGAHADGQLGRKREPVGDRFVEAALPITAVAAARERDRIEHQGAL